MSDVPANIDDVDVENYVSGTLHPEVALKELGFKFEGTSSLGKQHWLRKLGRGFWESVIVDAGGKIVYRKVKVHGRGVLDQEFTVHDYNVDADMNDIRSKVLKWKQEDAQEVIHRLLDSDPDAFDPRAELDRILPSKCPECGSSNISNEADDEGLLDCMNCGIWWNPLHPANAPNVPGNYPDPAEHARQHPIIDYPIDAQGNRRPPGWKPPYYEESLEDEIEDLKAYAMQHGLPPRVTITFSRTTPESVEAGDYSENGWEDEDGVVMALDEYDIEDGLTLADITAKYLKNEGASASFASSSHFHPGVWYSTEWSTLDYGTGEQEERNFHLVGFTAEQEKEVWDKMHARERPVVWQ